MLKAIGALTPPSHPSPDRGESAQEPPPPAPPEKENDRVNLMAEAIMRHEAISNRVHSKER